jgi:hypothetical protein
VTEKATPTYKFIPPGCYVVAYTKYESAKGANTADRWCDDRAFAAGLPDTCKDPGKTKLSGITPPVGFERYAPDIPNFYAEITLDPSSYTTPTQRVSSPRLVAMYYPKSLLKPGSKKPRTLTVSLTLTSAGSPTIDVMKAASLAVVIPHIVPGESQAPGALVNQQAPWISMPASLKLDPNDPRPTGGPYYPVNISAQVKEIGDPSAFLSAFSTAVTASASDYTKAVTNSISPAALAATEQTATANSATYLQALAQAQADLAKLIAACTPTPTTEAAKAAAQAAYDTVIADRQKANAAALTAGQSQPFANLDGNLTKCF